MIHFFPCDESRKEIMQEILETQNNNLETLLKYFKGKDDKDLMSGYEYLIRARDCLGRYYNKLKNGN